MENIILEQINSLENTLNFQARKIHILENHLKLLSKFENKKLSEDEQFEKQIILSQYYGRN